MQVMGAPEPARFQIPVDWNEIPLYFIVMAIGLGLIGVTTFAPLEDGRPPVWPWLVLVVPIAWLGWQVIRYLRERREFRFEVDAVEVPRLSLFGRPVRIRYTEVDHVVTPRRGLRLELSGGATITLRIPAPESRQIVAALQLRVGHALDRRGRPDEALELYQNASFQHEPPLDARIAFALWRSGHGDDDDDDEAEAADGEDMREDQQGDILTGLHLAAWEHGEAFGPEHPSTVFLRRELERYRDQHPGAKLDDTRDDPAAERSARMAARAAGDPTMQDRWLPVEA